MRSGRSLAGPGRGKVLKTYATARVWHESKYLGIHDQPQQCAIVPGSGSGGGVFDRGK